MDHNKSLDPYIQIITALLRDVQTLHSDVFTPRALRLTIQKINNRCAREGIGFLTKTLRRLGKTFDRALTGEIPLDASSLAFSSLPGSKLPKFLGELFQCIFSHDGWILPTPCVKCIKDVREILYFMSKLELPYTDSQEQKVLDKFERTEQELESWNKKFAELASFLDGSTTFDWGGNTPEMVVVARLARILLHEVFKEFDPRDIHPKHGPGAVSTRERLSQKYVFSSISPRIAEIWPIDAYFYASNGHICDDLDELTSTKFCEDSARVILVPKDSRGPRLISCEPLSFQWIQQGLGRAIVQLVETCPLTRYTVHFTDQQPNQFGALLGSQNGRYSTLDLNEASDRVTVELVRLLFPEHLIDALLAARSESTTLPDGRVLKLQKYAPMGSALCFPVLALTVWSLLQAGLSDAAKSPTFTNVRNFVRKGLTESLLVYGDDVVVETAKAEHAMHILESFGLKINRDKSCFQGFFRESCGVDAYRGVNVTPVKLRTVWHHRPRPDVYVSYIAYANELHKRGYLHCYDQIVEYLSEVYGQIPGQDLFRPWSRKQCKVEMPCPALVVPPMTQRPLRKRWNKALQRAEYLVYDVVAPKIRQVQSGWRMLLRFFAERSTVSPLALRFSETEVMQKYDAELSPRYKPGDEAFRVSSYTDRDASYLAKRWRG